MMSLKKLYDDLHDAIAAACREAAGAHDIAPHPGVASIIAKGLRDLDLARGSIYSADKDQDVRSDFQSMLRIGLDTLAALERAKHDSIASVHSAERPEGGA